MGKVGLYSRRGMTKLLAAGLACPAEAAAQQVFRGWPWAAKGLRTTATTGFHPVFTKTGAVLHWVWPDGTFTDSNAPTKNLAAGTKTVKALSRDGFALVTTVNLATQGMTGSLPSFADCINLTDCRIQSNVFYYNLPSFAPCTLLSYFNCGSNAFSGPFPSFNTCTELGTFACHDNLFSGLLPSFAACTKLTAFYCGLGASNTFSSVVAGSFATQKSLATAYFQGNAFPASAVNQILVDFQTSLGIPGRVTCTVTLNGGTNAAPTIGPPNGVAAYLALIAAGWTVTIT